MYMIAYTQTQAHTHAPSASAWLGWWQLSMQAPYAWWSLIRSLASHPS